MSDSRTLKRPEYSTSSNGSVESYMASCVSELMNASISFHKLHLKITGSGSFAAHKALGELYEGLPGLADSLAEGFQGACEKLLEYKEIEPKKLGSITEAMSYLKDITSMINGLQAKMPYSEIINELDNVKDLINSSKYKLLFLK